MLSVAENSRDKYVRLPGWVGGLIFRLAFRLACGVFEMAHQGEHIGRYTFMADIHFD